MHTIQSHWEPIGHVKSNYSPSVQPTHRQRKPCRKSEYWLYSSLIHFDRIIGNRENMDVNLQIEGFVFNLNALNGKFLIGINQKTQLYKCFLCDDGLLELQQFRYGLMVILLHSMFNFVQLSICLFNIDFVHGINCFELPWIMQVNSLFFIMEL